MTGNINCAVLTAESDLADAFAAGHIQSVAMAPANAQLPEKLGMKMPWSKSS